MSYSICCGLPTNPDFRHGCYTGEFWPLLKRDPSSLHGTQKTFLLGKFHKLPYLVLFLVAFGEYFFVIIIFICFFFGGICSPSTCPMTICPILRRDYCVVPRYSSAESVFSHTLPFLCYESGYQHLGSVSIRRDVQVWFAEAFQRNIDIGRCVTLHDQGKPAKQVQTIWTCWQVFSDDVTGTLGGVSGAKDRCVWGIADSEAPTFVTLSRRSIRRPVSIVASLPGLINFSFGVLKVTVAVNSGINYLDELLHTAEWTAAITQNELSEYGDQW